MRCPVMQRRAIALVLVAACGKGGEDKKGPQPSGKPTAARNGRAPLRLDWILVGGPGGAWSVESAVIVRDRDPATGASPSDHDPVVADLRLEGPQRPCGTRQ